MKRVLLTGPVLTRSGYGEHARTVMRALRKRQEQVGDIDVFIEAINWGQTGWVVDDTDERRWVDKAIEKTLSYAQNNPQFDMSIQVTIPTEFKNLAPVNIGVTAGIETDKVSPQWLQQMNAMTKVFVPSNHAKEGFVNTTYNGQHPQTGQPFSLSCMTDIEVIPYPVKEVDVEELDMELEYDFNFLSVAQISPRKNLGASLNWFVQEFHDKKVGFVLKISTKNHSNLDKEHTLNELRKANANFDKYYPKRKCKFYLLHGDMTDEQMRGVYTHPKIKCLISATHGEGYGLPLFEAAANGLPIVATDWSGHKDFLYMKKEVSSRTSRTKNKSKSRKRKKTSTAPKKKLKDVAQFFPVEYELKPIQKNAVWGEILMEGSNWAYPKEESFKKGMREVYKKYASHKKKATELQQHILKNYTVEFVENSYLKGFLGDDYEVEPFDPADLPKISILTSVYDGDEFIEPFLKDITRQTIFKDKCELILINANSPGKEEKVIKKYMKKFPKNIVYLKLDEDPGIYGTWNKAIELSTGEYLTNANLDDRKAINSLELHARELFLNDDIDLVYADSHITNNPNETFENNTAGDKKYNFPEFSFENLKMANLPHNNPMWRKSVHEKAGMFNAKYRSAGDWDMFLRMASKGSKFKKVGQILGLYYFNPTGVSTNPENFEWKREEEQEIYETYKDMKI